MLERFAHVKVSVADCKRRKGPGAPWVGVGVDQLRVSNKSDVVGSRCSRLRAQSARISPCNSLDDGMEYPAFPAAPGATFHAAPEDNLFAAPKHHPPNYDQGKWYDEQVRGPP